MCIRDRYTVTYIPQCVGQHRVEIQVNGQPLTGSPWFVQVIPHQYQFAFQFGSKGREQGRFNSPWGIAVNDKSRTLAVADFNNKRIQMFGFEGNFLGQIALNGKPRSLTFTESGDLLVCALLEVWSWRIFLFTENGRFMSYFGGEHVKAPYYISVSSDVALSQVTLMTTESKFLHLMGKTYFSRSKPQVVMKTRTLSFITRKNSLLLFLLLAVSWYLTTQGSIFMILAASDLVTGS